MVLAIENDVETGFFELFDLDAVWALGENLDLLELRFFAFFAFPDRLSDFRG